MKFNIKKAVSILMAAVTVFCSLSFLSCGNKLKPDENGYYYCSKNGVTYKLVSYEYTPIALKDEKYATLEDGDNKQDLYPIMNAEPEKWLATSDGTLFCAVDEQVPELEQMEIDNILICREGTNAVISLAEIKNADAVATVLENIKSGSEIEYPAMSETEEYLSLRMSSEKYPWLYYSIIYVEFVSDVYDYDYPENLESYVYRDVDDDVSVETYYEFQCRYDTENSDQLDLLVDIAQSANVDHVTMTQPDGNGGTVEVVVYFFKNTDSFSACISSVISNYKGELAEDELHALLDSPSYSKRNNVVEYNYGKYFIFDRMKRYCVKADTVIHDYKELTIVD